MTAVTENRKRSRNVFDDDSLEFVPLSKRINNLHINTSMIVNAMSHNHSVTSMSPPSQWGPGPPHPHYNPELTAIENPYYYNSNKVLFDLYLQRMQRNGHNQL